MTPDAGRTPARRHRSSAWLAVGLAIAGLALATAGPSRAGTTGAVSAGGPVPMISIKLVQAPPGDDGGYIIGRLQPGATGQWHMQIANTGQTTAHVSVYPAAASISGGVFQYAAGHTRDRMTPWVRISDPVLTLQPRQRVTDTAVITVPRSTHPGAQYGVIWAQAADSRQTSRVGIRVYLSVGSGRAPATAFSMGTPAATRQAGQPALSVPVRNTGGLAIDLAGSLLLSGGPGGQRAGPFTAPPIVTLAPGQTGNVVFTLNSSLPGGSWHARVTLHGGTSVRNGDFGVSLLGNGTSPASGLTGWQVAGVAAAVALIAIVAVVTVRSRRRATRGRARPIF